jgi:hypothetical protein
MRRARTLITIAHGPHLGNKLHARLTPDGRASRFYLQIGRSGPTLDRADNSNRPWPAPLYPKPRGEQAGCPQ